VGCGYAGPLIPQSHVRMEYENAQPCVHPETDLDASEILVAACAVLHTVPYWKPILRKEVIQPHLPIRLPCYDFVPLTPHTFGGWLLAVTPPTSGADNSGDVTGGVYKARERIQRSLADLRLLAIPASRRRVAAYDPN
jgi:hypothetical protein